MVRVTVGPTIPSAPTCDSQNVSDAADMREKCLELTARESDTSEPPGEEGISTAIVVAFTWTYLSSGGHALPPGR